ncbi:phytase [Pseudomonas stutzeri]|uniref:3-phytase n=1 Tax=Stutzerimonas stutzeri TaxID=316 RepID=A0A2N8RZN4_STUST|nr:phytase [Stutzerimonas stutzeri]MCQ4295179.1 phytase [Stutzerimonas stutzeri]PNF79845.1 3-phytase [Stutzerimonas stutzeri]
MYALPKTALLSLCISLAACQSANHDEPINAVQLSFSEPVQAGLEYAQLTGNTPWASAERIQVDSKGLHLLDASGRTLAEYAGRFEGLDHRADQRGLFLATVERKRQQAMLIGLDGQRAWSQPLYLPRTAFAIEGLCLYRDSARNDFVFLLGEEGVGEQWLVASQGRLLDEARRVRGLSLPPESAFCQTDDATGLLYVNEETVGLWRYPADAEAPLQREPVDLRQPFGGLAQAAAGMALVPGGLLALDPEVPALHLYRQTQNGWKADAVLALEGFDEPEQISARRSQNGVELLLADEQGVHRGRLAWQPQALAQTAPIVSLPAAAQTDAVPSLGDAADDPAIWINPRNPAQSRVLGTDKKGGLLVYDLDGRETQNLRVGRLNNVDVRGDFRLGAKRVDLAVASNRDHNSLHLFAIDQASGVLDDIGQIATPLTDIYGLCMFKDRQGGIHAIANDKDGTFLQYRLDGSSGKPRGELVRRFKVETQPEGCVADDRNERLFVGEEDVAVWVLDARVGAPTTLEKVIGVGGPVYDDIEGLALYQGTSSDYLVISSQGNDSYVVLDAQAPYAVRGAFRIGLNAERGIDGASETDGLEVTSANLGGIWSRGMLVVQDGRKRMPEGAQNYKYLPWSAVADALGLD